MPVPNLPAQPTPFLGRAEELAEMTILLTDPACRLLTLVGPGGIGKSRLALEVAAQLDAYPDGVHFIALQPLTSSDAIVSAIANAINFQFYPGSEPKQQLLSYLSKKHLLLLLDNFEHLLEGAGLVSDVLAAAPRVRFVVTSRERLNLTTETVFNVGGLRLPDRGTAENVLDFSAVKLFVQSARHVRPDFTPDNESADLILRICRLVGGMPLAILLAAAWVEMLPLREIAAEIERGLELLETEMRDLPERHRSVRATFDYSWGRLSPVEQEVFKKLTVFRSGFSREAAQEVAGASLKTLLGLVNKSFVQTAGSGRYDIHELLRQYGAALASDAERDLVKGLHAVYYAGFISKQHLDFQGADVKPSLQAVSTDYENIHLAWDTAVHQARWHDMWKFTHSFEDFSFHLNRIEDALPLYAAAVARLEQLGDEARDNELLGALLAQQAYMSLVLGRDFPVNAYHRAVTIMSRLTPSNPTAVRSLCLLGFYAAHKVDLSAGEQMMRESIALSRERGDTFELTGNIIFLMVAFNNHNINWAEMKALNEEAYDLVARQNYAFFLPYVQRQKGQFFLLEGSYAAAKPFLEESYRNFVEQRDLIDAGSCLNGLGYIAWQMGNYEEALHQYSRVLVFYLEFGNPFHVPYTLYAIAGVLVAQGKRDRALQLYALVQNWKGITIGTLPDVVPQMEQLKAELPPSVYTAAVERGRTLDVDATVQQLVAEWNTPAVLPTPQPLAEPLTERELEILGLVAVGRSNREIADELFLALSTVKWYITEIYGKLSVRNRTEAVARAREINLLS